MQVIGQIPSNLLLTRINPGRWLPFCELAWTLCTRTYNLSLPLPSPSPGARRPQSCSSTDSLRAACAVGMMGVKSVNSIYLLRFFIGLFESSYVLSLPVASKHR
jgi:hypothetical protein